MALSNDLDYYNTSTIIAVKGFTAQAQSKSFYKILTWGLYYKTFYGHNLQIFVIS